MAPRSADKHPLQQVGRYAIYDEIASGGMATVHLARFAGPHGFSRVVAAKRLHPHLMDDETFKRMFLDEARLAARIRHPNVVPTLDVLVDEREVILVMEYVHGESLLALERAARDQSVRIPLPIATAILVSVLNGLHAAHEARDEKGEPLQIVHRDVSPHNVLVGADGGVRVLDFGVAKAIQARPDTRPGTLKGKFSYMAPEVLRGEGVSRQADVFAAAVVFWELLTGKKLFGGANEHDRMLKILNGSYPPPSALQSDVGATIDRIAMRGLDPDLSERYATARDMAVDVETNLPIASQRIVSEWVQGLAAHALERRGDLLQQIEVSYIKSVAPPALENEEAETIRIADDQSLDEFARSLGSRSASPSSLTGSGPAIGSSHLETNGASKRSTWLIAGAAALVAAGITLLIAKHDPAPSTSAPVVVAAVTVAPPAPAPLPAYTAAPEPPQDPPSIVVKSPQSATGETADNAPKSPIRGRPARPAPPPRHAATRAPASGNAKTFLPDDL